MANTSAQTERCNELTRRLNEIVASYANLKTTD